MKLRICLLSFLLFAILSHLVRALRSGRGRPVQDKNRLSVPGVFLHAILRRPGKRILQKVWHRV